jgi:glucose uptake protein GlcU
MIYKLPFNVKNDIMIPITMGIVVSAVSFFALKNKTTISKSILISLTLGTIVGVGEGYYGWIENGSPKK